MSEQSEQDKISELEDIVSALREKLTRALSRIKECERMWDYHEKSANEWATKYRKLGEQSPTV